jgi:hypothetical protein
VALEKRPGLDRVLLGVPQLFIRRVIMSLGKRAAAEFFGTYWLVFGGCGAAVSAASWAVEFTGHCSANELDLAQAGE